MILIEIDWYLYSEKAHFSIIWPLFVLEMILNITQTKKYFTTRSVLIFLYIWNKNVCDCSKETLNLSTFSKKKAYF